MNTGASRAIAIAVVLLLAACSDGATRLAQQIEAEVHVFEESTADKKIITHRPIRRNNNGCEGAFRLQIDRNGALIIWCIDSVSGETTASHMTTSHSRYIDSPQTWIVDKKRGESVEIELQKKPGAKPQVIAVR